MIDITRIVEIIESEKLYPEIQSKILVHSGGFIIALSGMTNCNEYRASQVFRFIELDTMFEPYLYIEDAVSSLMGNLVETAKS